MSGKPPVVIIGAGVGGLTLALLLRQRGIVAEVLEQSAELRRGRRRRLPRGQRDTRAAPPRPGRSPGPGLDRAHRAHPPRRPRRPPDRGLSRAAVVPGDVRRAVQRPAPGRPAAAADRRVRARAPAPGLPREGLEEHGQRVRVRCSSGAVFEAGLVVGADGVHSLVRDWVTGGDEPVYSGTSGFPRPGPGRPAAAAARPRRPAVLDGTRRAPAALPDRRRPPDQLPGRDRHAAAWTAPAWMAQADPGAHLEAFAGWHPAVTEMISAVPQSPRWGLFARRPLARWSRGPPCCWAMPPTPCSRTTARARTRRSRTRPSWPPN